jgi:NADPH-dependent 2,4-dienoyl-CoA reductase/sulfur reductase-like enzyme
MTTRRKALQFLGGAASLLATPFVSRASAANAGKARVVVVGGGFGGATTARYLKRHNPEMAVTLIEPDRRFYTCPFSNLVLGGLRDFESIGHGFDDLRRCGVTIVHSRANAVDNVVRKVTLADGVTLDYDRLVLSPGVDMRWDALEGYDEAASLKAPHAWKAGEQTLLLKRQLDAMDDGEVFILVAPDDPFRCPPGPYERVGLIAHYFQSKKPKSKILILDAKDSFSKKALFLEGWKALYGDMIEWVCRSDDGLVIAIDAERREAITEFGTVHKAGVLNVVPPQKAGAIAAAAGVTDNSGWVPVNPVTFESRNLKGIYVVGDATIAAPMPKSGFCANAQGKVVAAAISAELAGREPSQPSWINTCYSVLGPEYGISVADVYRVSDGKITAVPDSGGVSPLKANQTFRAAEAHYARGWYESITRDIWGAPS